MESPINEIKCKIIIVGDSDVGKTSIMNVFCKGTYTRPSATVGVNYDSKRIQIFDKYINLNIWDTAGQEKYYSLTKGYFREAIGVIFVYDVTCQNTLFNIGKWFDIVKQEVPNDVIKILVGNKCDLNSKQISVQEGKRVADIYGLNFFEISSKENINVSPMFYFMAIRIVNSHWDTFFPAPSDSITLTNQENNNYQNASCFVNTIYSWFKN